MESGARRLVKRLLAAGLRDLAELKERSLATDGLSREWGAAFRTSGKSEKVDT